MVQQFRSLIGDTVKGDPKILAPYGDLLSILIPTTDGLGVTIFQSQ